MSHDLAPPFAQWSWNKTRLRRALLFLVITWSIAGAFLVLNIGSAELVAKAASAGIWELIMPAVGMANAQYLRWIVGSDAPQTSSAGCDSLSRVSATVERTRALDPRMLQKVRRATWTVGRRLGFAAAVEHGGNVDDAQLAELLKDPQAGAQALGVPAPSLPKIQRRLYALVEFTGYLEADPQRTAAELARHYGASYGSLYKLATVIGYAMYVRARYPEVGALHVQQIRCYGQSAGLPQELWFPLTQESLEAIPGIDPREKVLGLVSRIEEYISTSPPP